MARGTILKFAKLGQMRRRPGSRDLLLNFETPLYGTTEDTNFNFGTWIGHEEAYPKIAKLGQLGTGSGHLTYFYILGPPLYLSNG